MDAAEIAAMTNEELRNMLNFQLETQQRQQAEGDEVPAWFLSNTALMMTEWNGRK